MRGRDELGSCVGICGAFAGKTLYHAYGLATALTVIDTDERDGSANA